MMRTLFTVLSPAGRRAKLTTLIFHRVMPTPDPMFPDEMYAGRFDEICGWLARWFNVLPLDVATERLVDGSLPARALCITFDDGYRDNHDVALPILRRHGLPATFFIATGFLDGGRMWNDTVIESVRGAQGKHLDLRAIAEAGLSEYALEGPDQRRMAVERILGQVKYLPVQQRLGVVAKIAECAEVRPPDDLMMSSGQVRAMHAAGMQTEVRSEMDGSKKHLEQVLQRPVTLFAYPNGKPGQDYRPDAVQAARELGFKAAVSTAAGVAVRGTDHFQLPRFTPWDTRALRFGGRLAAQMTRGVPAPS
jgi:peptidoglycan/xylan/chitin deacetylase (PgdA/CDA1 family)